MFFLPLYFLHIQILFAQIIRDIKIIKYAHDMALVGLLNYKTDHSFYYDAIEHYIEQCRDVNLLINAKKTQEIKVTFSNTQCKTPMFSCVREKFYGERQVSGKYLPET